MRNRWLFDFGLIACVLVIPFALVFGAVRGIPFWWRLIDCSFGVFGFDPAVVLPEVGVGVGKPFFRLTEQFDLVRLIDDKSVILRSRLVHLRLVSWFVTEQKPTQRSP